MCEPWQALCDFQLGRQGTLDDFRGLYRLLKFVLKPETLMKRAPSVFERYRRPGRLTITTAEHGRATASFEGCAGFHTSMWHEIAGGSVAVLESCGAKNARLTQIEVGAPGCATIETRWE